jgi:hypothetical protein
MAVARGAIRIAGRFFMPINRNRRTFKNFIETRSQHIEYI